MYLIVSPNQLGYFKPTTTARRLKAFLKKEGDVKVFLGHLHFIEVCHKLFVKIAPLDVTLYQKEVDAIYEKKTWNHYLAYYFYKLRLFFKNEKWLFLLHAYRSYQRQFLLLYIACQQIQEGAKISDDKAAQILARKLGLLKLQKNTS